MFSFCFIIDGVTRGFNFENSEISRILRLNGYFLYTDLFPADRLDVTLESLRENGFVVERNQDITTNVLLSCDERGKTHYTAFSRDNDSDFMSNFLGVPGSTIYNDLKDGKTTYRLFKLKKVRGSGVSPLPTEVTGL